jgi:serine/threonine-protein kinase RsbW
VTETVSIRVPASPEFVQVVRLVAAGLAARLHFTLDEIEDLKIGVDELTAYLTGPQGRDGTLEIRFTVGDDRIQIRGVGHFATPERIRTELSDFSRMILATVADSATLDFPDSLLCFDLLKTKRS